MFLYHNIQYKLTLIASGGCNDELLPVAKSPYPETEGLISLEITLGIVPKPTPNWMVATVRVPVRVPVRGK